MRQNAPRDGRDPAGGRADACLAPRGTVRGGGIAAVVFLILQFIGFSYRAAVDPGSNLMLSMLGFTLGVGLCEEVCKALPLLWRVGRPEPLAWRGACLWGLASGAGFGVSEGVTYSQDFYNGIMGGGIYVVRFVSCVSLHAVWSATVALALFRRQDEFYDDVESWYEYILPVLRVVAVPMILHGAYDTLLKKDMDGWALLTALVSFGILAAQIERLRREQPDDLPQTQSGPTGPW